jgi:hypothetical protein
VGKKPPASAQVITGLGDDDLKGIYPNPVTNGNISISSSSNISKIDIHRKKGCIMEFLK